jgi:hypothetical protein
VRRGDEGTNVALTRPGAGANPGPPRAPSPASRRVSRWVWALVAAGVALALAGGRQYILLDRAEPRLRLAWATAEPWPADGAVTTVEIRLVVENAGKKATNSTSVLWEPGFAGRFTLASSDPPAWRVRIDEWGRGVLDTSGFLPGRSSTIRLVFTGTGPVGPPPQVMVVANGHYVIAETIADVRHFDVAGARDHDTFERGVLAAVADRVAFVPSDARGAFPLAALVGLLLATVLTGGGLAAARSGPRS